jgi:hypothetical protein
MKRYYFGILFLLCFVSSTAWGNSIGDDTPPGPTPKKKKKSQKEPSGLNVKFIPAFFWNSAGLEVEVPVANRLTVALSGYGKLGRTDSKKNNYVIPQEPFLENGYMVELAARYYPTLTPKPAGLYAQVAVNYGNLLYFDGTTRPFSINQRWRKLEGNNLRNRSELKEFQPYGFSLGGGYQVMFVQRKIIANLGAGIQGNIAKSGGIGISVYVTPSIGIFF